MEKELNENTGFNVSIKTLAGIGAAMATVIGMWFVLQADIAEAKLLPEPTPPGTIIVAGGESESPANEAKTAQGNPRTTPQRNTTADWREIDFNTVRLTSVLAPWPAQTPPPPHP